MNASAEIQQRSTPELAIKLGMFLKIDEETQLVTEIKDIMDEINIILAVLESQEKVVDDFVKEMRFMYPPFNNEKFRDQHQSIANNIHDFQRMKSQANKTYNAVSCQSQG